MMNTTPSVSVEEQARPKRLNFSDSAHREEHIQAFQAWLPPLLRQAPDLHWDRLPSSVMRYLILTVGNHPDVIPITLAAGCAMDAMKASSLLICCSSLKVLLDHLRAEYGMCHLADLGSRLVWDAFVAGRTLSSGEVSQLSKYDALSSVHLRRYLERLDERNRLIWEAYVLPPLPTHFVEKDAQRSQVDAATQKRRKERSDVLVPLFPLLIEIAQLRKQAAERLVKEFRHQRDRASAGEIQLPYQFVYVDRLVSISKEAETLSSVEFLEREVTLNFTLWNRSSWVQEHLDRFSSDVRRDWERQVDAYAPARNTYFLQYHGEAEELLWCGDLIVNRAFAHLDMVASQQRQEFGRQLGEPKGFYTERGGLLIPKAFDVRWFRDVLTPDEIIFEPESFYRGVLYATALATLAMTNGSRVNELLQVSATRFETIVVDELKNQQPTGRKIGILVQTLLPKGAKTESERQFFLISDMAARLLREIGEVLAATHGGKIPIVQPYRNQKAEDLSPEPYLFQWGATPDGRLGLLYAGDVQRLLRFLFHGLTLTTRRGEPIKIATHLLRHVLATHARQVKNVPAEAVAYLLHHRVTLEGSSHSPSIPEATAYYSRMPVERLLALLFEAQAQFSSSQKRSYLQVPPPRTLEQMESVLRQVFEQWGTIGPTVLGYCSAGLCIRPNNRALCLGCPYLVPHYSNLGNAKTWRKLHMLQAQLHDSHGHFVDAEQFRQMIQHLDDIIRVMEVQIRTRRDGGYLPFADTLLPTTDEEGETR